MVMSSKHDSAITRGTQVGSSWLRQSRSSYDAYALSLGAKARTSNIAKSLTKLELNEGKAEMTNRRNEQVCGN